LGLPALPIAPLLCPPPLPTAVAGPITPARLGPPPTLGRLRTSTTAVTALRTRRR